MRMLIAPDLQGTALLEETECRCETLVLLCFKQFCAILTQNSRNWAVLQLLCANLVSFSECADTQCRCWDWGVFLLGFVSCPFPRKVTKERLAFRELWMRVASSMSLPYVLLAVLQFMAALNHPNTILYASCTQWNSSHLWQLRFSKPGCTSAHMSASDPHLDESCPCTG